MQNAKITITVPYDEIPKEAESLISRSTMRMYDILQTFKSGTVEDLQKTLKDIDYAREKLILVDSNFADAYNILLGYLQNELAAQQKVNNNESQN